MTDRPESEPSSQACADALERVLASRSFAGSPRHRAFLDAVVRHTLEQPSAEPLKETTLGIDVFGRDAESFDPKVDNIVRVEARRLRERLATYYRDEGQHDPVVVELPRGGYRPVFLWRRTEPTADNAATAPAEAPAVVAPAVVSPPAPAPDDVRGRGRAGNSWLAAASAAVIVLAIAAGWRWGVSPRPVDRAMSVAVVPLANSTGDPALEPVIDGLTDELIDGLARLPGIAVTARTSSFAFKGKPQDVRAIGRSLGVDHLVEGSVQHSGDTLKIIVQVVSAATGTHLWSHAFETTPGRLAQARSDMVRGIATALNPALERQFAAEASRRPVAPEAWDLYARALHASRSFSPDSFSRAVNLASQSVALDPDFADAHVLLATMQLTASYDAPLPAERSVAIEHHLKAALRLDPDHSLAHSTLGGLELLRDLDWTQAQQAYETAMGLSPRNSPVIEAWAGGLVLVGDFARAGRLYTQALALDPLSVSLRLKIAHLHLLAGDAHAAHAMLDIIDEMTPRQPFALYIRVLLYALAGDPAAARATLSTLQATAPAWHTGLRLDAIVSAAEGRRDHARTLLAEYGARYGAQHPYSLAAAQAWVGDADAAVRGLRDAIARQDLLVANLGVDPLFDPIRRDRAFQAVTATLPHLIPHVKAPRRRH